MASMQRTVSIISILFLVLLGAGLRQSYNSQTLFAEPQIRADSAHYLQYGLNIVDHSTFSKGRENPRVPDAYWAPGYPTFIAANLKLSRLTGRDEFGYELTLLSQVALGSATILLSYLLAGLIMPGYWPLLPAALVTFSPHLISLGSYMLTETLLGFLVILSLYLLARALVMKEKSYFWGLSGLSFGAAYMVNPVTVVVPLSLVLALGSGRFFSKLHTVTGLKSSGKPIALLLIPPLLVALAWSVRGHVSVPAGSHDSSDRLLANLSVGLYADYYVKAKEKQKAEILNPGAEFILPGEGVVTSYETFFLELKGKVVEDPMGMLRWYLIGKPLQLWGWDILNGQGDIYVYDVLFSLYHISKPAMVSYSIMRSLHPWLVGFCLLGLIFALRESGTRKSIVLALYTTIISVGLVYVVTQSEPRYSVPLRPEMYIAASYFFWKVSGLLKSVIQRPEKLGTDHV